MTVLKPRIVTHEPMRVAAACAVSEALEHELEKLHDLHVPEEEVLLDLYPPIEE